MVFALDTDNGALLALSSPLEAPEHCKGIDVRDGYWLFFAADGSPLEARFAHVNQPEDTAHLAVDYILQRAISGLWLQERLDQVATIEGCGLTTTAQLAETLKVNRGKPGYRT